MTWDAPPESGNSSGPVLYGTFRAFDASDFDSADCIETDESDLTADDSFMPDPGIIRFYLVRGVCSNSVTGTTTGGGSLGALLVPEPGIEPG